MSTLNVSWTKFALSASVAFIVPVVFTAVQPGGELAWLILALVWFIVISVFCFTAFGWARLRKANSVEPVLATDRERIVRLLVGPIVPAVVWFVAITVLPVVLVVAWMLYAHAA